MADRERRARHRRGDAERPARSSDEGRLPGSELARDGDDVADREALGEGGRDPLGLARRGAGELDVHVRTGRAGSTRGRARARLRRLAGLPARLVDRALQQRRDAREVLLEHLQHRRRVERGRGVVERVQEHRARAERHLLLVPVHLRDARRLPREELRREVPERRDELRLDQLDLAEEVRLAGRDLLRERVAVPGRAALEDIRDEDVRARQLDPAEELVEQLPRLADERDALLVLVEPGRLADEHQVGVRASRAEHDLRAALRERAAGAASRSPRRTLEVRRRARRRPSGGQSTASPGCSRREMSPRAREARP